MHKQHINNVHGIHTFANRSQRHGSIYNIEAQMQWNRQWFPREVLVNKVTGDKRPVCEPQLKGIKSSALPAVGGHIETT